MKTVNYEGGSSDDNEEDFAQKENV